MTERCRACRFWKLYLRSEETDPGEDVDAGFGWCRRNPPVVLDHMARMTIPPLGNRKDNYDPEDVATVVNVYNARVFPATFGTEWCGRYEPRAGEAPAC